MKEMIPNLKLLSQIVAIGWPAATQNLLAKSARHASGGSGNAAIAAKGNNGMGTALWNVNPLGAGTQSWIGKVNFVTE